MKYLLDTNVVSELVSRRPNPDVVAWIDGLDPNTTFVSVILIGEIRKGIEKLPASSRKDELWAWLTSDLLIRFDGRIAPVSTSVMLIWGELAGRLEKLGRQVAAMDSIVAAIALEGNYALVTRNEADFKDTGAVIVNPWK